MHRKVAMWRGTMTKLIIQRAIISLCFIEFVSDSAEIRTQNVDYGISTVPSLIGKLSEYLPRIATWLVQNFSLPGN